MLELNKLHIKMFDFHAAHYLPPTFGKCNRLHGHTYTFEDIEIETEGIVDFSLIKKVMDSADHTLLVPEQDAKFWVELNEHTNPPCGIRVFTIPANETTVEAIARYFHDTITAIPGVKSVKFILYETKHSGAVRPPR